MSGLTKKIVAVFFAVWLPLFSGSALATSVQMPAGHCDDASMQMADMGDMDMHHMPGTPKSPASACDACGVCHLACTAYLAVPGISLVALTASSLEITPYLLAFRSVTSVPLLPPPLARV